MRHSVEYNSKRHINQNISYSSEIPEEMAIVAIISAIVMNKYIGPVNKLSDNMPVSWVMVIVFMIPVRIWVVSVIIVSPAVKIPAVSFPVAIPVFVCSEIVITVVIPVAPVIIHVRRPAVIVPNLFTPTVVCIG